MIGSEGAGAEEAGAESAGTDAIGSEGDRAEGLELRRSDLSLQGLRVIENDRI